MRRHARLSLTLLKCLGGGLIMGGGVRCVADLALTGTVKCQARV